MAILDRICVFLLLLVCLRASPSNDIGEIRFGDTADSVRVKSAWAQDTENTAEGTVLLRGEFAEIPECSAVCCFGSKGLSEVILYLCNASPSASSPGNLDEDTAALCFRLAFAFLQEQYGEPSETGEGRMDMSGEPGSGGLGSHAKYDEVISVAKALKDAGYSKEKKLPEFSYLSHAVWSVPSEQGTVNIQLETVSLKTAAGYESFGTNIYFWLQK